MSGTHDILAAERAAAAAEARQRQARAQAQSQSQGKYRCQPLQSDIISDKDISSGISGSGNISSAQDTMGGSTASSDIPSGMGQQRSSGLSSQEIPRGGQQGRQRGIYDQDPTLD
ncbi:hypothetical protein H0H92_002363 [Tricholoma furcatifolium]|nr:hypothetical protein H0H92_002363 [Tricholoma furcatifolium]